MYSYRVDLSRTPLNDIFATVRRLQQINRMTFTIPVEGTRGGWLPRKKTMLRLISRQFGDNVLDALLALGWPANEYTKHPGLVCLLHFTGAISKRMVELLPLIRAQQFGCSGRVAVV